MLQNKKIARSEKDMLQNKNDKKVQIDLTEDKTKGNHKMPNCSR
jgi:hypothetical protein